MKRNATAVWHGTGKEGTGHLTTQSTTLNKTQYSFNSRFAEGVGTNPEELIAAAHAGCFTMKVTFLMQADGLAADELSTNCVVTLDNGTVTHSALTITGKAPGLTLEKLTAYAEDAKANCVISKLLNCEKSLEVILG